MLYNKTTTNINVIHVMAISHEHFFLRFTSVGIWGSNGHWTKQNLGPSKKETKILFV